MDKYKVLIGLEMHCEISKTNSKVFSAAKNEYTPDANTCIRAIDLAFPGILPVVNKEAVRKSLMVSMILNCTQPKELYFERKNYYYPDLPKGYQLTQETKPAPIGSFGEVKFMCDGVEKKVRVNNLHLEEDAASMQHFSDVSLIDYNRAGVPLLELVTEPDLRSSAEAVAFLEHMRSIYQYTNISEADSKKGQIRCDVNVSIMDKDLDETDPKNWGTKIEVKNVNSFGAVRDAIEFEIKRQIEAKEDGTYDEMQQQTRRWDDSIGETVFMRSKVDAIDYKYFIEPNIPRFILTDEWLKEIRDSIPELADARRDRYMKDYKLSDYDASILVKEKAVSDYFEDMVKMGVSPKTSANWVNTTILGTLSKLDMDIEDFPVKSNILGEMLKMVEEGTVSRNQAKDVLREALDENKNPLDIIEEKGIKQIQDDDYLEKIVDEVLAKSEKLVEDYKSGKTNAINAILGGVMKETKGKANPSKAMQILKEKIGG